MGQILVGGATTLFPNLRLAFFVGDVLIKRDCRRLQELATNVNIIKTRNPSFLDGMSEFIPAGKGMYDVQLLVVNQEDRSKLCSVGEVGEIYVRAGGLAEGYLGEELTELTRTKFVTNWFVDPQKWITEDKKLVERQEERQPWREYYYGPRDRLYRSGDLGRYLPSGDVECTGRADNQVKIRGFRIELGEIDAWCSKHNLVQENVTLLRRNKDEEPTLVTYLVPNIKRWQEWLEEQQLAENSVEDETVLGLLKRFRALRENVRGFLQTKLPGYAVPTFFVPLRRMPLNPNGKIDKPALPFPDAAELSEAAMRRSSSSTNDASLSKTEKEVAEIWGAVIPNTIVKTMRPEDSFFDLGGHSILAQYMIAAVKKKWQTVDVDITTITRHPMLGAFASEIDRSLDPIGLRLDAGEQVYDTQLDQLYTTDASNMKQKLMNSYLTSVPNTKPPLTVFLTGATGFLGVYILRDLLQRKSIKVIAHVRAKTTQTAFERVQQACQAYSIWSPDLASHLECVPGDLTGPKLGMEPETWEKIANETDVVIHNGAQVHWVLPYASLKPPNVLSTLSTLSLCSTPKPKTFTFVSSTSILDTDHYVQMSNRGQAIPESDDLEGSRKGLGTGYGQSKWVSEQLIREAGRRGLNGMIVRPGYVSGESQSGVTNTDDFLVRYLKTCTQLRAAPNIQNTVNMVPVDHVARAVVACALYPSNGNGAGIAVSQVTAHPRITFTDFGAALGKYGYDVALVGYEEWKQKVLEYVEGKEDGQEELALMPLLHFVAGDLPSNTIAPDLDDSNTRAALAKDAAGSTKPAVEGVTVELVGTYLAYLIAIGFMPPPPLSSNHATLQLPKVELSEEQRELVGRIGGRSSGGGVR
ncbi:MAG: hypothetical protein Q9167_005621 [Letrouitia subvulpina]